MNHLGGSAGGSPGKIPLFNQQSLEITPRSFAQNACADNASADNDHIPTLRAPPKLRQKLMTIGEGRACKIHGGT